MFLLNHPGTDLRPKYKTMSRSSHSFWFNFILKDNSISRAGACPLTASISGTRYCNTYISTSGVGALWLGVPNSKSRCKSYK